MNIDEFVLQSKILLEKYSEETDKEITGDFNDWSEWFDNWLEENGPVIEKGNYISRIYFFYSPLEPMNVLVLLWRKLPNGNWTLNYRFRYYNDDKIHDSQDIKNRYTAEFPESNNLSENQILEKVQLIIDGFKTEVLLDKFKLDITEISSDDPTLILHLMQQKPYFHSKL